MPPHAKSPPPVLPEESDHLSDPLWKSRVILTKENGEEDGGNEFTCKSKQEYSMHIDQKSKMFIVELIEQEKWSDFEKRVKYFPEITKKSISITLFGHKSECLLLHALCLRPYVPFSTVKMIVEAYPDAIRKRASTDYSLPIHIACRSNVSPAVIRALLHAFPESAWSKDKDGNLPLHYACSFASPQVVQMLFEVHPDGVRALNSMRQLPLHLACSRSDASSGVIDGLVAKYKEACISTDWQGRVPLHSASMLRAPVAAIDCLLKAYPETVHVKDAQGYTPYDLCRKRMRMPTKDPVVKKLRKTMLENGNFTVRSSVRVKFYVENVFFIRRAAEKP